MSLIKIFQDKQRRRLSRGELFLAMGPFVGAIFLAAILIFLFIVYGSGLSQKDNVIRKANSAYDNLSSAYKLLDQTNLDQAATFFQQAAVDFQELENNLNGLSETLKPLSQSQVEAALHLARAGKAVSSASQFMAGSFEAMASAAPAFSQSITLDSSRGQDRTQVKLSEQKLTKPLQDSLQQLSWSKDLIRLAITEISQIDPNSLPEQYRQQFGALHQRTGNIMAALETIVDFNSLLVDAFSGQQKNILLLFQNTSEARPTGGFIGSYGLLKIREGSVASLLIESVYEIDGRLNKVVEAPDPLKRLADGRWYLRDANWWPDFKKSGENIAQFYEWEGGETPDLVVSLTPSFFENVMAAVGPIEMEDYDVVVDKDNFFDTVQQKTSKDYDKEENKPKKFMADLATEIFEKMPALTAEQKLAIIGNLLDSLSNKDILLYSRDAGLQGKISALGLSGELVDMSGRKNLDSLLISNANVGGGKTDKLIKQDVSIQTEIGLNKTVNHILNITRTSAAKEDMEFPVNVNYLRIYAPKGAKLISSNRDVQTYEELGRTVFASTVITGPGQTSNFNLKYSLVLPRGFDNSYSFLLERNPGQVIDRIIHEVELPKSKEIVHTEGSSVEKIAENSLKSVHEPLLDNKYFGTVYK